MDEFKCTIQLSGDSALRLSDDSASLGVCPECYLTAALETFEQLPLSIRRLIAQGDKVSLLVGFRLYGE